MFRTYSRSSVPDTVEVYFLFWIYPSRTLLMWCKWIFNRLHLPDRFFQSCSCLSRNSYTYSYKNYNSLQFPVVKKRARMQATTTNYFHSFQLVITKQKKTVEVRLALCLDSGKDNTDFLLRRCKICIHLLSSESRARNEYLIFILLPFVDYHIVECNKEKAITPKWTNRRDQKAQSSTSI